MDYFVLKADKKLKESQSPYRIPGCKDSMLNIIDGMIPPTAVSVSNRHLEWLIPNNQLNQQHISTHYSHFSILKAGEESTNANVKLMENMPPPLTDEQLKATQEKLDAKKKLSTDRIAECAEYKEFIADPESIDFGEMSEEDYKSLLDGVKAKKEAKKPSPQDIQKLKAKRVAELKELGVDAPKNSSLPKLDELLNAKREEILNS
jgi:hypothetical protein